MTTTASTSESPKLELALKSLWGASRWPGFADSTVHLAPAFCQQALRRLHQLLAVRASGLVHGPHGVGKSFLLHRFSDELSPKQYRLLRLTHSTLMGSDLLRQLVILAGSKPQYRRGDNVLALAAVWQQWAPVWPVLIVEEAQDLNTAALEELRLLTCARTDTQSPFSLILVGDEDLLPRLDLGINRALMSRLGFCLRLDRWPKDELQAYLQARLAEVGIHASPLEPAAEELLLQSAQGSPRTVNSLLQRTLEIAATAGRRQVSPAEVQSALDTVPWVARLAT
ncbi:MAG TPA: AAA family ATPase [Candidatus Binatia bacterium]|nr:AAA family ATPase [Candidatus Binatia bacterium]